MKQLIVILIFLIGIPSAKAQDSVFIAKPRIYGQLGVIFPLPYKVVPAVNVAVVLETKENLAFGLRYYGYSYNHDVPASDNVSEKYIPEHVYEEANVSIGKVLPLQKNAFLTLSAGPSFVYYKMPYNVKKVPSPSNSWGGFFNYSIYEYEVIRHNMIGGSLRGDLALYPGKKVGLNFGGFFSFNQQMTLGGVDISLVIGKSLRE
ncbi:hypothetical protein [Rufibacter roseus]|uniref:Outer membrane protein beta-barrel domain-containing protein n=1 Tax=Rufibacter roseus TaxID=1567108 RepID=A0ABW2DPF0_9BACT|nr:hypothetical protein [Rufibacter roseus]